MQIYLHEWQAWQRVETIKRVVGVWPGVVRAGRGWRLTYDPAIVQGRDHLAARLEDDVMRTVKLEIEFEVGTLHEIGLRGLKVEWVSDEQPGRQYSLIVGEG